MSYPRIFERVYCQPVCITAERFSSIHSFLLPRVAGSVPLEINIEANANPAAPTVNPFNGKRRQKAGPSYDVNGAVDTRFYTEGRRGIAVIPIYGVLAKNLSAWEETCGGGTDINAPQEALRQAVEAPDIHTIVLDIDSPGGEVTGIPEFAALVRRAGERKLVYAFTDASMCSAAYWLGSQAREIYATRSASVGSIGTYLAWLDPSVKMQLEGIQLRLFAEGKHKGIGLPGRPLTADDEELLRRRVKTINNDFRAAVTSARPSITDATMQGQAFSGEELLTTALVDGFVTSWDEFLDLIG